MAILKPVPSATRGASFGTRTSSKTTSEVSAARWPSLFFMRCFLMPGRSAGNTKAEMPAWRAFRSRVAKAMYHCATLPFEMKCFGGVQDELVADAPVGGRHASDVGPSACSVMQYAASEHSLTSCPR